MDETDRLVMRERFARDVSDAMWVIAVKAGTEPDAHERDRLCRIKESLKALSRWLQDGGNV
jgi:hypothetical protein